jgi:hypothetical protein
MKKPRRAGLFVDLPADEPGSEEQKRSANRYFASRNN